MSFFPAFSTQFVCVSVSALVPVARERDLLSEQEVDDLLDEYGMPMSLFVRIEPTMFLGRLPACRAQVRPDCVTAFRVCVHVSVL